MKVPRHLIGKPVELVWVDPMSGPRRVDLATMRRGRGALASWREYGRILDVSEGVVALAHALGTSPGDSEPDEVSPSWIAEDLITELYVLDRVPPA